MKMILKIYAIHDSAANAYLPPFFQHNDGIAIRSFQDNVNSTEENNLSKHPDQFTLFHIGEYDDSKGIITPADHLKSLGNGLEYKNIDSNIDLMTEINNKLEKLMESK
jgi:hypothetical protein